MKIFTSSRADLGLHYLKKIPYISKAGDVNGLRRFCGTLDIYMLIRYTCRMI